MDAALIGDATRQRLRTSAGIEFFLKVSFPTVSKRHAGQGYSGAETHPALKFAI
jgi:hypothetical protein